MKLITTLVLSLLCTASFAGQYNRVLNIGDTMPSFTQLPGISGQTLSSDDLKADVVVLVSLANHCPWVRGMDTGLVALATSFTGQSVDIVSFSVNHRDEDRLPAMKIHAQKVGYNFPYVFDESQALGKALGATRTPEYFVFNKARKLVYMGLLTNSPARVDRSGNIKHINGEPSEFYVQNAVQKTLDQQVFEPAETRAHGCSVKYL